MIYTHPCAYTSSTARQLDKSALFSTHEMSDNTHTYLGHIIGGDSHTTLQEYTLGNSMPGAVFIYIHSSLSSQNLCIVVMSHVHER